MDTTTTQTAQERQWDADFLDIFADSPLTRATETPRPWTSQDADDAADAVEAMTEPERLWDAVCGWYDADAPAPLALAADYDMGTTEGIYR